MRLMHRAPLLAALLLACTAASAAAQRVIDWNIRTTAGAEAVVTGAGAIFWNPAAAGALAGRGEALVLDLEGPETTGLKGVAGAAAVRLPRGATIGLGYEHLGIGDIQRTDTSPLNTDSDVISVAEDRFTVVASQPVVPGLWIGAMAQYERANEAVQVENQASFGAGIYLEPAVKLHPALGGAAFALPGSGARWDVGGEADVPGTTGLPVEVRLSYGVSGTRGPNSVTHRIAGVVGLRDRALLSLGAAAEPSADGRSWQPMASASLRIARYLLGITREQLSSGFGETYSFRIGVTF